MSQCSTPNPKETRQEAGMKSSMRPDTTLNGSIRRHSEMTEPPRPEPVWVDSLAEEQMRDGSCHKLTWAACCTACFWGGGRSRAFALSAVMGILERFLEMWRRVLICQLFGPYTTSVWRIVLWNGDVWASAPHSVITGVLKSALCQNKRKAYKSLYSMEYWDEWKQHTPNFQQYASCTICRISHEHKTWKLLLTQGH